jgi:hypothetical protein
VIWYSSFGLAPSCVRYEGSAKHRTKRERAFAAELTFIASPHFRHPLLGNKFSRHRVYPPPKSLPTAKHFNSTHLVSLTILPLLDFAFPRIIWGKFSPVPPSRQPDLYHFTPLPFTPPRNSASQLPTSLSTLQDQHELTINLIRVLLSFCTASPHHFCKLPTWVHLSSDDITTPLRKFNTYNHNRSLFSPSQDIANGSSCR